MFAPAVAKRDDVSRVTHRPKLGGECNNLHSRTYLSPSFVVLLWSVEQYS